MDTNSSLSDDLRLSTDSSEERDSNNNIIDKPAQNKSKSTNGRRTSRSQQSGLLFPVSRVENRLREGRYASRISPQAAIHLAGVLEYLVAETLELAGDMCRQSKRKRIIPRDIALAIKNDDELAKLCEEVTIPQGGVQPFIHEVLLKKNRRRRTRHVRFDESSILSSQKSTPSDNYANDSDLQME
ncbi:unnamed protein product [Adineta ricciae]|uniref:Histone H2A n=1 Tax=Adineta ricciae TaxID=249248 RepID=A0A815NLB7_ADIRI|nr:unnamed protein product [Adineta ricciae]CAF1654066.1 unnamed protein product [Adineta ricciae]